MGNPVDRSVEAIAGLGEPLVRNDDDPGKLDGASKRHAMLGDVHVVFGEVELDFYELLVATNNRTSTIKCRYEVI